MESGIERRLGAVWVAVPRAEGVRIDWLTGNPTRGRLGFALTSPTGGDAEVTVVDASGRSVFHRHLGSLGAGRSVIDLAPPNELRPGIYWVRVAHAAVDLTMRVVVLQ